MARLIKSLKRVPSDLLTAANNRGDPTVIKLLADDTVTITNGGRTIKLARIMGANLSSHPHTELPIPAKAPTAGTDTAGGLDTTTQTSPGAVPATGGSTPKTIRLNAGKPVAIGGFDIARGDQFVSDMVKAFGQFDSQTGAGADNCTFVWSKPQMTVYAANLGAASGTTPCAPESEYVNDVVIRSPDFRTASGVRVGTTVSELQKLVPDASTKFTGQLYQGNTPTNMADSTYRLAEIDSPIGPTGKQVTLAALVKADKVVALEVTPLLGGD